MPLAHSRRNDVMERMGGLTLHHVKQVLIFAGKPIDALNVVMAVTSAEFVSQRDSN